ncbi:FkbM family methyltransferase [Actinomadura pelletieri DSM 43383]|uniref:FkbM family methyltransferase n=1 Tax=Actinomadura pelletieri DSM 43383 TaxID=1120940 RepID=A0A495QH39_9ACTN|nr:FkbM family methyltransferase [Actinomadura pelletieri]RKS71041.1 FkbM family methyltransferase [Actinomadura pelletieri DSM 43383]
MTDLRTSVLNWAIKRFGPFIRRHPRLRAPARRVHRLIRPAPPARPVKRLALPLPPDDDGTGPATIIVPPTKGHSLLKLLLRDGIGGYEPDTAACFLAALRHAPAGAALDVGANIGLYSVLAGCRSDRPVYGFEPTPALADLMRRMAATNDLRFHTEQLALGDANGTATLYLSNKTDLSNSLAAGFRTPIGQLDVPVETLDHWCARRTTIPGLIKIDTETTEPAVIRGALQTIRRHRPWIFCEILPNRRVEEPVMELLRDLDYPCWYHIAGDPPYEPREKIVGDDTYEYMMWLFTPEPVAPEVWRLTSAWRTSLARTRVPPADPSTAPT